MDKKDILNKLQEDIATIKNNLFYLEGAEQELSKNVSTDFTYYETPFISDPEQFLYIPEYKWEPVSNCKLCQGKQFKLSSIDNNVHFNVCSCLKGKLRVSTVEITTYCIQDETFYVCYNKDVLIRIPASNVLHSFSQEDLSKNITSLFYDNKTACDDFCNCKNKELDV